MTDRLHRLVIDVEGDRGAAERGLRACLKMLGRTFALKARGVELRATPNPRKRKAVALPLGNRGEP